MGMQPVKACARMALEKSVLPIINQGMKK